MNVDKLVNNFVNYDVKKSKTNSYTSLRIIDIDKLKLRNDELKTDITKEYTHTNLRQDKMDFNFEGMNKQTPKLKKKKTIKSAYQIYIDNQKIQIPKLHRIKSVFEKIQTAIRKFMDSKIFAIFFTLIILTELFLEDIKIIFISPEYDFYLDITIFSIACCLILEMIAGWIIHVEYRCSLFFLVDLLSNISLLPYLYIFDDTGDKVTDENDSSSFISLFLNNSHISKTSKASLAGSKFSKFYTVLKIFRLFSLGRIYKYNLDRMIKKNEQQIISYQKKEQIKQMRRKCVVLKNFDDKMKFFKDVHNVLNIEEHDETIKKPKINRLTTNVHPKIIENFYEYAMKNEKKMEEENDININEEEESKNETNYNFEADDIETKTQFKNMVSILNETKNNEDKETSNKPQYEENVENFEFIDQVNSIAQNNNNNILSSILKSPTSKKSPTKSLLIKKKFCMCKEHSVSKINLLSTHKENKITKSSFIRGNIQKGNAIIVEPSPDVCDICQGIVLGMNLNDSTNTYTSQKSDHKEEQNKSATETGNRTSSALGILEKINTSVIKKSPLARNKTMVRGLTILEKSKPKFFEKDENIHEEDHQRLSFKLSRTVTIRVVILILIILFINPFLELDNYNITYSVYNYQVDLLANLLFSGQYKVMNRLLVQLMNTTYQTEVGLKIIEIGFNNNYSRINYNLADIFDTDIIFSNSDVMDTARKAELIKSSNTYFYIIYDYVYESKFDSVLNLCKIIFVCLSLYLFTFYSIYDIHKYLVIPLEDLFNTMKDKKLYMESIYYEVDNVVEKQKSYFTELYEEEIFEFEKFFRKMSQLLIRVLGIRCYNFFIPRIFGESELGTNSNCFFQLKGVIMVIDISNYYELIKKYNNDFTTFISDVLNLVDLTMFEHYGEIIHIDHHKIVIVWDKKIAKDREDHQIDQDSPYNIFFISHIKITTKFISMAIIAAVKLLGRINHEFNEVKMNISINKGVLNYLLINSSSKIDVAINSLILRETNKNLRLAKKYGLQIVISKKAYEKLDDQFQDYCRIVPEKESTIYTYDISYDKNIFPYKDDSIIKSDHAFMERKKNAIILNKVMFDIGRLVRIDLELLALRASNSKIFIKYYQLAFKRFIQKKNKEALDFLEEALKHRPSDYLCMKLKYNIEKYKK